jgi:opacity protein-like surface antigen
MKQLTLLSLIIIASASTALAQSGDDYNKWDLYGGYSLGRFETNVESASFTSGGSTQSFTNLCSSATGDMIGPNFQKFFCERRNFNGFEGSMAYNVSRYVGLKADVTGHFKSQTYVDTFTPPGVKQTISNKERLWNFLGGVQIKDNSRDKRVKPFAHALAGVARYTNRQSQTLDLFPQFNFVIEDRDTSFALKLGGGLDIRASEHVDIRVIEFDYNPVFAGDRQAQTISGPFNPVRFEGKTAHNFTIGFGIVIH